MASLVDSHVHLDRYSDEEVTAMVSRGAAAGVRRLLTIGVDLATSKAALRLAGRHPEILAAVGIHPTHLESPTPNHPTGLEAPTPNPSPMRGGGEHATQLPFPRARGRGLGGRGYLADLRSLLDQKPSAIGEVGLDESAPDLEGQQRFLAACVDLAHEYELPLVLHVVGAPAIHEAALQIVGQHPAVRTVAHYFVGGPDLARRYVEAGCWISVGRPATRPSEADVRAGIPTIPLDRLLLETDTYPLPGRTTEPRDVAAVCAAVAELREQTYETVAAATTANFGRFIGS
ncbi:MAG TPA: TatD family hydrolase [Chloroflexota bacterium]|nr:TatD family hydrolase [Chloroflexota bacterium]